MFCTYCGTQNDNQTRFCTNCGKPTHGQSRGNYPPQNPSQPQVQQPVASPNSNVQSQVVAANGFVTNVTTTKSLFCHCYRGIAVNNMVQRVNNAFLLQGYVLKEGNPGNGVYTKGNRTARIVAGALSKYFKFTVKVEAVNASEVHVTVGSLSSGMSGGIIGINQVKKEVNRLSGLFRNL